MSYRIRIRYGALQSLPSIETLKLFDFSGSKVMFPTDSMNSNEFNANAKFNHFD